MVKKKTTTITILAFIIVVVLLLVGFLALGPSIKKSLSHKDQAKTEGQASTRSMAEQPQDQPQNRDKTKIDFSKCHIDIEGYKNKFYKGIEYKIFLIMNNPKDTINIKEYNYVWNVKYKNEKKKNNNKIKIEDNTFKLSQNQQSGDTIIIELKDHRNKLYKSREISRN